MLLRRGLTLEYATLTWNVLGTVGLLLVALRGCGWTSPETAMARPGLLAESRGLEES